MDKQRNQHLKNLRLCLCFNPLNRSKRIALRLHYAGVPLALFSIPPHCLEAAHFLSSWELTDHREPVMVVAYLHHVKEGSEVAEKFPWKVLV